MTLFDNYDELINEYKQRLKNNNFSNYRYDFSNDYKEKLTKLKFEKNCLEVLNLIAIGGVFYSFYSIFTNKIKTKRTNLIHGCIISGGIVIIANLNYITH